ncbi:hypothetical protein AN639_07495 [Candidatus Epulonipiscium fishelsonii]|uniref:Uncharacterized protein n=1 Tax=Candidatus Epulonipiscium fishelsonii TaxID=77094 RepID=A0ACC8XEU6_9FIRM|nr:hypothetical protein AN639_07495 [Epulopiscium sp. SCG-B05WGA-EpuloA1]ONI41895.1 hypothetical protein AN396_02875 [Epulopiscium sp. SCG-B11WGA-EpuloA1]
MEEREILTNQVLFIAVVILSNIVQVLTGFAGTMLAMPASMQLIGINEAKAVLNAGSIILVTTVAIQNYKYINKKEATKITVLMLLGMGVGVYLLQIMPTGILLNIYAYFVIFISLKKMFIKNELHLSNLIMILIVFLAGIVHGMFVSGGSLLVIYAVTALKDKDEFRATLAVIWAILSSILFTTHIQQGFFTPEVWTLTLITTFTVFLSVKIGNKLHDKINQQTFLKIVYVLLFLSGLLLIL